MIRLKRTEVRVNLVNVSKINVILFMIFLSCLQFSINIMINKVKR